MEVMNAQQVTNPNLRALFKALSDLLGYRHSFKATSEEPVKPTDPGSGGAALPLWS